MVGGLRLIWALGFVMFAAVLWSEDGSSTTTSALAAPPKAKVEVVEETIHGRKIADPYRWLEDSNSAGTQEYVSEQLAYTRSILDPLPGRERIHQRLKELLSIGTIGTPQIGGRITSTLGEKAARISRCCWCVRASMEKIARWWM